MQSSSVLEGYHKDTDLPFPCDRQTSCHWQRSTPTPRVDYPHAPWNPTATLLLGRPVLRISGSYYGQGYAARKEVLLVGLGNEILLNVRKTGPPRASNSYWILTNRHNTHNASQLFNDICGVHLLGSEDHKENFDVATRAGGKLARMSISTRDSTHQFHQQRRILQLIECITVIKGPRPKLAAFLQQGTVVLFRLDDELQPLASTATNITSGGTCLCSLSSTRFVVGPQIPEHSLTVLEISEESLSSLRTYHLQHQDITERLFIPTSYVLKAVSSIEGKGETSFSLCMG